MSPDLLPAPTDEALTMRLRFYDVIFAPAGQAPAGRGGRFREAVVAVAGSVADIEGEVSLFMWTDSSTYMTWGREVFGWPLRSAEFSLTGTLWQAAELPPEPSAAAGVQGRSEARVADGTVAIEVHATEPATGGARPAVWITPRRILRSAGCAPEEREVLLVHPEILAAGRRYVAVGTVGIAFSTGHTLSGLPFPDPSFDIVDGFRILVGAHVETISETEIDRTGSDG